MGETSKEVKSPDPLLAIPDGDSKVFVNTSYCSILPMPDIIKQITLSVFRHYQMMNFEKKRKQVFNTGQGKRLMTGA